MIKNRVRLLQSQQFVHTLIPQALLRHHHQNIKIHQSKQLLDFVKKALIKSRDIGISMINWIPREAFHNRIQVNGYTHRCVP